jgi:decaprenyl-diphosphate synthase subunit 2
VVELIARSIGDLMEAEFTGFTDKAGNPTLPSRVGFSDWLQQIYLQSGSLLARSCKAAMKLASHKEQMQQDAFNYGLNLAYVQHVRTGYLACLLFEYHVYYRVEGPAV